MSACGRTLQDASCRAERPEVAGYLELVPI
eukprot:COSAG02_NODE_26246_length_637_cov_1.312268_1_plen_29_part_10